MTEVQTVRIFKSMKEQKYPARIALDFVQDSDGKKILKSVSQWKRYAEKLAIQKSKIAKFSWNSSVMLCDDPEIHLKSFNYVSIGFYHQY